MAWKMDSITGKNATSKLKTTLIGLRFGAAIALAGLGSQAFAQDGGTQTAVNSKVDWDVIEATNPTQCYARSTPKETVNTRDGRVVAVRRGEILLFVFYDPSQGKEPFVYFTGGYPFAPGSSVSLEIGEEKFSLFTEGEGAWPATPSDDAKIIAAMKRGASAVLTARSSRGTQTKDTFSLLGFTAAVEDAGKRCAG